MLLVVTLECYWRLTLRHLCVLLDLHCIVLYLIVLVLLIEKSKLDEFLESFLAQHLSSAAVPAEDFSRRVQMAISLLSEPPQSYGHEAQAIWSSLRDDLPIDYRQQVRRSHESPL